jgi:putative phosphoribosyl transferase
VRYRVFQDRRDAGQALVSEIRRCDLQDPLILGLPRGGIPVAFEVATALGAPLDVIVVRKLGAPFQPELAIGAIASGGIRVLNEDVLRLFPDLGDDDIERIAARESLELERRERQYRGEHPFPALADRDVVLIDDGLATGATMLAAVKAVRSRDPASITVAVPTGSTSAVDKLSALTDRLICLETPPDFRAVGLYYVDFAQTSDAEVRELLAEAKRRRGPPDISGSQHG